MNAPRLLVVSALLTAALSAAAPAQPPSFSRQVKPFLDKYCLECHGPKKAENRFDVGTARAVIESGISGPNVVPGKPDDSLLVLLVEKKCKPFMPPKTAKLQPTREERAIVRAWVAAGAPDDVKSETPPPVTRPAAVAAAVTAAAYRPDGKLLAAAAGGDVYFVGGDGTVLDRLGGQPGKVTALAFNPASTRLAVAGGAAGKEGVVRLYDLSAELPPKATPVRDLTAHTDLLYALAFSPDGKTLATAGYDRLIKLWDVAAGGEPRVFKDHSDTIYGLAFSPDGKLLASAAADRAVKVWDVATGRRLYTLGDATDWLYAVAWSPDGRHLAAGGVDKSIRVWEATAAGGTLLRSAFAHEGPVLRLAFAADGGRLYSLGEDRVVKAWDANRLVETHVYDKQPETALTLAVRPDRQQLAVGRFDGALVLLDEATGKVRATPLPEKPMPPQVTQLAPPAGRRSQALRLTFTGKHLDAVTEVTGLPPGATFRLLDDHRSRTALSAEVTLAPTTAAGVYQLGLKSPAGSSKPLPFTVDLFDTVAEAELNDSPSTGQPVTLPVSVVGAAGKAGDVDYFRFQAQAGQQLGVQAVTAATGSKLAPVLELTDETGTPLAVGDNGSLGYTFPRAGVYALGIRDQEYRGGGDMTYRLHLGDVPVVTSVFPLGLRRGTEATVTVNGVHLGGPRTVTVKAGGAAVDARLPISVTAPTGTPLGVPSLVVGEFPEVVATSGMLQSIPVPGTANGRITQPGATDTWTFRARKGERLILETNARRLGSPLDSFIKVLDADVNPVPRATLRCLARTYVTFRDHDSSGPNIRIESWGELAVNDYVYVGNELLRIRNLPTHPDSDCFFFSVNGVRAGMLDTTPAHLSLGLPMYKVAIHPPGTTFPPNGFPVITLPYRNDDGGPRYGKDSRLFFDPPADGEYRVRVGDARGAGGEAYGYRLTVRPPRPSFRVSLATTNLSVWKGGAVPVRIALDRLDGFDGPVDVRLENLPPGFSAPPSNILPDDDETTIALWADATAVNPPASAPPLKVIGRARIGGQEVVQEGTGGVPKLVEPGDLLTATEQGVVTIQPGKETRLTVTIERRNGFKGRVPLEVRGLPHGVRVLDIGLNGILINPQETRRTMVLYAEPFVRPAEHPFVVLSKREGKNTEHAARSVLLRVAAPTPR